MIGEVPENKPAFLHIFAYLREFKVNSLKYQGDIEVDLRDMGPKHILVIRGLMSFECYN